MKFKKDNTKSMIAIETEAVFENNQTLRLNKPVYSQHADVVRVILLMDESIPQHQDWPEFFFEKNYGSCEADPLNIPAELVYETNRLSVE